ncbi:MAG: STAS domain-containing protein [Victivallaceae bacterium]
MHFEYYDKDGIVVIQIKGRLDAGNVAALKSKYRELSVNKHNFVFDLSEMEYVDSTGLGSIVSCLKSATEAGGDVKLACLKDKPRMIFEITRAYKIFDIFDDLDAAIEAFTIQ